MIYNLRVDQVSGLPDMYRVTRRNGKSYTVRGFEALGRRLKKEAVASHGEGFTVCDQNGRALIYKAALGVFVYN